MSRTSEYTLDLVVKDDQARKALNEIAEGFDAIGKKAKESIKSEDVDSQIKAIAAKSDAMIAKVRDMAVSSPVDFDVYFKTFAGGAKKAIGELEKQYASLVPTLKVVEALEAKRSQIEAEKEKATKLREQCRLEREIQAINEQLDVPKRKNIRSLIQQNRQIRANLETAKRSSQADLIATKKKEALEKQAQLRDRVNEIRAKKKHLFDQTELKAAHQKLTEQEKLVKAIKQAEKSNLANVKAVQAQAKAVNEVIIRTTALQKVWNGIKLTGKLVNSGIQNTYNITGMVGGAARTAIGAGNAAFGMVSGAISSVSGAADKQVDREKQAARIKGSLSDDEKQKLLQQVYIKTGADYGVIVDAINAIQNTFGQKVKSDELAQAAAMEIQYPGTASTFLSSTEGESNMDKFKMYANRLKAIQGATGASTEQIQASTKFVSQYANHDTGASVSQLQAVYLAMQNQGVFNSEEELQTAFKRFVSQQAKSGVSPVEFAQQFDWSAYAKGADGQTRASNALTTMDWGALNKAATTTDTEISKDSEAKSMAEKMRELEEKKNEMMMKLIPVIMPVVEELSKLLNSSEGQAIIDGLIGIFKTVLPLLEPIFKVLKVVLDFANDYLLRPLEKAIRAIMDWLGDDEENEKPELANGGIASMPSICGERGPEAIIPLDFSRAARATNIATNISQTFQMTGNQTTALSLAQAVRSRDFSRAMTDNLFITNRCGGF
ncbi:MAG: hypothetical protein IJ268_05735 [Proteobacteria bacterium]|nr:hypothetical protein [Pseudomonadota bacterium]